MTDAYSEMILDNFGIFIDDFAVKNETNAKEESLGQLLVIWVSIVRSAVTSTITTWLSGRYYSALLDKAQRNYPQVERELLGIVKSLKAYQVH